MPATPYMKLYIGDYLGDTQHLSCLEHGAYLLLIMAYWQNKGPLPYNPKLLRRYTRTDSNQWRKCSENVLKMFQLENDLLIHHRIEKELNKREQVSTASRDAINTRWHGCNTDVIRANNGRNTTPIVHSPESIVREDNTKRAPKSPFVKPNLKEVHEYCQEREKGVNPEAWLAHYESNGWRVGKNPMKDWKAAVRTWEHSGIGKDTSQGTTDEDIRLAIEAGKRSGRI